MWMSRFKLDSKQAFEKATQKEAIDSPICMHGFSIGDEFLMHIQMYTCLSKNMAWQAVHSELFVSL